MRDIHDLFLPRVCVACGLGTGTGLPLCPPCTSRLAPARTVPDLRPSISGVSGLWAMDPGSPIRPVLHAYKYQFAWYLSEPLGQLVAKKLPEVDALVPIPLHRTRRWERGYDQAVLLAREAGAAGTIPVLEEALERHIPTSPQAASGRAERLAGPEGAFRVRDASAVRGLRVCLIDDVITTGATCRAAAEALSEAGVAAVYAAAVGVVRPRGDPGPIPM